MAQRACGAKRMTHAGAVDEPLPAMSKVQRPCASLTWQIREDFLGQVPRLQRMTRGLSAPIAQPVSWHQEASVTYGPCPSHNKTGFPRQTVCACVV